MEANLLPFIYITAFGEFSCAMYSIQYETLLYTLHTTDFSVLCLNIDLNPARIASIADE